MAKEKHRGSSFDSFLKEEGLLEEVNATAMKRVIAWQLEQLMKKQAVTKSALAERMHTSRAQVNRLLDHDNPALTLESLSGAARALGQVVRIELLPAPGQADAARRKLDALGIKEGDIEYATRWARRRKK
jgi:DNA-binding Xre family transcriptional regulator